MPYLIVTFIGGGLGACTRFFVSTIALNFGLRYWIGTLLVNLIGCVIYFSTVKFAHLTNMQIHFVRIGFLGSLTTFSAFAVEIILQIEAQNYSEAFLIFFLNISLCLLAGIFIFRIS